jgi:hypothetical protein
MNASDIETSSKRAVLIDGTVAAALVTSAAAMGPVGEVFEDVQLGHDPDGAFALRGDVRRRAARQQCERPIEAGRDIHVWQRPIHHLADRPVDDRRVAERSVEQALLGDRPDERLERVPVGRFRDRQLADAVFLEDRDGLADALRGPGDDEIGEQAGVVAVRSMSSTLTTAPVVASNPLARIHSSLQILDR